MPKSSKRIPLYARIRDYLKEQIRQGVWKSGERLPSENELAAQFKVSRITIKQAMADLAEEGLVYRIQGRGTFAADGTGGEPAVIERASLGLRTDWAAFLLPSLDTRYTANLLKGIEGTLAEAGCRLMFCRTGDSPERERELIREMVQRGAIGLIVYPAEGESYSEEILRLTLDGYPIVVIDRYLKGLETNCVCSDHRSGAHAATAHLLRHGHKRIAFVTTPIAGTSSLEDRLEGYKQALAEAMLPFDQRLVLTELHERRLAQFFRVNRDITAAFAVNAGIGLRVIDAVEAAGLRVPEDVSVAFFDTYDYASHARIPPTCVVQQEEEIGRQAAELLLAVIRNPGRERRQIVLKPVLVEGRSTGPAPRHGGSSEEPAPA